MVETINTPTQSQVAIRERKKKQYLLYTSLRNEHYELPRNERKQDRQLRQDEPTLLELHFYPI